MSRAFRHTPPVTRPIDCPDCGGDMHLQDTPPGSKGGRWIYRCENHPACNGNVGAHADGRPLGVPADVTTRRLRRELHNSYIDPLWLKMKKKRERSKQRTVAYEYLADRLGIPADQCHVGLFNAETCRMAMAVLHDMTPAKLRAWKRRRG